MSSRGFTLIEAVVATLVGVVMVVAVGRLGESLIRQRVSTDFDSAAMSFAERQMETLLADPLPKPQPGDCSTTPKAKLCGSVTGLTHPALDVNANGTPTVGGPYRILWTVTDLSNAAGSPFVTPAEVTIVVKKITITVRKGTATAANATLVRYFKAS